METWFALQTRRGAVRSASQQMVLCGYRRIKVRCGEPLQLSRDHQGSIMERPDG